MRKDNNLMYSLSEHREKIITNIQDFLNYKRTNTIDFGSRLMNVFKVVDFSGAQLDENLFVKFEGYDSNPQSNHYWVSKKELDSFLSGKKSIGVNLTVDRFYNENGYSIIEVNLIKNGFKKMYLKDAEKFRGIQINYNGKIYKSYDVQVSLVKDNLVGKIIRIFVIEPSSGESYINKHTVVQNKVEIKNGITFEDFDNQEQFVRKFDALEAVRMERKNIVSELKAWFSLNMSEKVDDDFSVAFIGKLNEII